MSTLVLVVLGFVFSYLLGLLTRPARRVRPLPLRPVAPVALGYDGGCGQCSSGGRCWCAEGQS